MPKRNQEDKRAERVVVFLTSEERKILENKAEANHQRLSEFIRYIILRA